MRALYKKRETKHTVDHLTHRGRKKNPNFFFCKFQSVSLNKVPVGSNLITCDACGQQPALKSPAAQ